MTHNGYNGNHVFRITDNVALLDVITTFIVWLAPRAGKMNQILRCDWLPERAR